MVYVAVGSSEYSLRTFMQGDERALPALFNKVYSAYAGFVPRTTEYWTWCCLNRPTVEKKGICIVEKAGQTIGYAAVAVEQKNGKTEAQVLELCYLHEEAEFAAKHIVSWIVEYAKSRKADQIVLDAATDDEILRKIVREQGFGEFPHVQPLMMILDCCKLVEEVANSQKSRFESLEGVFQFNILSSKVLSSDSFQIEVGHGKIEVVHGASKASAVYIETDAKTLASCIFGVTHPLRAILSGEIKVKPLWKIGRVAKLLSVLELGDSWFIPNGDFG